MSSFIIPLSSLPAITPLQSGGAQATQTGGGVSFANYLQDAIQNVQGATETNQTDMMGLALGQNDDMHTGAIASLKSSLSVNFASGLASAAIRAYNELMRMQI